MASHRNTLGLLRALLVAASFLAVLAPPAPAQSFDVLVRNGRILDGTGNPAFRADVGVVGGRIVAIGDLEDAVASRTIDATGLYVSPGFIDVHSHADRALASDNPEGRLAPNLVVQGITTVVMGADGRNPNWPIVDEIAAYRSLGVALNVVPMVGHGTVRGMVMGDDYERAATNEEIAAMRQLVREGMDQGAWGLGAGPEYRPGRFSTTEEIIALAEIVADYDGFYYSHQRSQSPLPLWQTPSIVEGWRLTGTDGMKETIRIGRETGIRVVGSHIKAKGPTMWGQSARDVMLINRARAEGVQVYLDQYPYETFGGGSADVIPPWAYAPPGTDRSGGRDDPDWRGLMDDYKESLRQNLADPTTHDELVEDIEYVLDLQGGADRHIIVISPADETLIGKTLAEVAEANDRTPVQQLVAFALNGTPQIRSGVRFRPVAGHTYDVDNYMRQVYTATSTDAGVVLQTRAGQHPRYFGTYPRKLGHYVRERGVISLPFAIRSSTGLPAQIVGLTDRGLIREGAAADLVIFDYDAVQDRATILSPGEMPEGIPFVLVNGEVTVDGGRLTGRLPGKVLDRNEAKPRQRVPSR